MLLRARGVDFNAYDKAAGSPGAGGSPPRQQLPKKKGSKSEATGADGGVEKGINLAEAGEDEEVTPSFWSKVSRLKWLIGCLEWLVEIAGWLVGWVVGLIGGLVDWLVGWLVGWLIGVRRHIAQN